MTPVDRQQLDVSLGNISWTLTDRAKNRWCIHPPIHHPSSHHLLFKWIHAFYSHNGLCGSDIIYMIIYNKAIKSPFLFSRNISNMLCSWCWSIFVLFNATSDESRVTRRILVGVVGYCDLYRCSWTLPLFNRWLYFNPFCYKCTN